jgi:hypothetical protein
MSHHTPQTPSQFNKYHIHITIIDTITSLINFIISHFPTTFPHIFYNAYFVGFKYPGLSIANMVFKSNKKAFIEMCEDYHHHNLINVTSPS